MNKENEIIKQLLALNEKRKKTSRFNPPGEYSKIKHEMHNLISGTNLILSFVGGELEITKIIYRESWGKDE